LAKLAEIPIGTARQFTYCLRKSKSKIIRIAEKNGRELGFQKIEEN
jgi:hypothetical protein